MHTAHVILILKGLSSPTCSLTIYKSAVLHFETDCEKLTENLNFVWTEERNCTFGTVCVHVCAREREKASQPRSPWWAAFSLPVDNCTNISKSRKRNLFVCLVCVSGGKKCLRPHASWKKKLSASSSICLLVWKRESKKKTTEFVLVWIIKWEYSLAASNRQLLMYLSITVSGGRFHTHMKKTMMFTVPAFYVRVFIGFPLFIHTFMFT